ncbi:MAG: hypothetical protein ACKO7C_04785 [Bacteroidota bacterium]
MIENISLSTHLLNISILFIAALLLGVLLYSSSERIQKRILSIELGLLFWILFQTTLSLNRWYMDQKSGALHLLFPFLFPIAIYIFLNATPRGKRLFLGLNQKNLILLQTIRIPMGILFLLLSKDRQAPMDMTIFGLNFDLIFGVLAMLAYLFYQKIASNRKLVHSLHLLGLMSMLVQMTLAFFSVAGPHQRLGITQPFYAATHFPFSLTPTVLFGFLFVAHLLAIAPKTKP